MKRRYFILEPTGVQKHVALDFQTL